MPARVGSVISPVGDMCVYAGVGYIISTVGNIGYMFSTFFSYRYEHACKILVTISVAICIF